MQLANDITLSVYKAVYESCSPGMTNRQFTSLVDAAYARCGVRGEASCQVAAFSAQPHGSPTPQVIRENQIVLIDDGCYVQGYQSDISRSFVYGKPTDRQKRVFDIVHQAQAAALAAARPGVEMQAVDAAARNVITDAGFGPDYKHFTHRVGHGIGMDMHEWYYLVRGNTRLLEANMTFSDEPGIYLPTTPNPSASASKTTCTSPKDGAKLFTPQSPASNTLPESPIANAFHTQHLRLATKTTLPTRKHLTLRPTKVRGVLLRNACPFNTNDCLRPHLRPTSASPSTQSR
jgi:Xaa-Pro dipeptidase